MVDFQICDKAKYVGKGAAFGLALLTLWGCGAATTQNTSAISDDERVVQQTILQTTRESEAKNEYDKAAVGYTRLFQNNLNDPVLAMGYLRNMRYSGNSASAIQAFDANASNLLTDDDVKFEYAKALLAAGRHGDALRFLNEVAQTRPNDWKVLSAIGVNYDAMERFGEAVQAYNKALVISPNNPVVLNNLGMSLAMSGRLTQAIDTLKRAAERDRQSPSIRQNLALLYAIDGDLASAKALAGMDLEMDDLEANMTFYRRFTGGAR